MIINISEHPHQQYKYNGNLYDIQRRFVENCFIINSERKFVSLVGIVEHFVAIDNEIIKIDNLNKVVDITATNKTLVYADTGEYIQYKKDEQGNVAYDHTDESNPQPIIINSERGVLGEFDFFDIVRNVPIAVNSMVQNVVSRHDALKRFDNYGG
jgi:hypothetical protein